MRRALSWHFCSWDLVAVFLATVGAVEMSGWSVNLMRQKSPWSPVILPLLAPTEYKASLSCGAGAVWVSRTHIDQSPTTFYRIPWLSSALRFKFYFPLMKFWSVRKSGLCIYFCDFTVSIWQFCIIGYAFCSIFCLKKAGIQSCEWHFGRILASTVITKLKIDTGG